VGLLLILVGSWLATGTGAGDHPAAGQSRNPP